MEHVVLGVLPEPPGQRGTTFFAATCTGAVKEEEERDDPRLIWSIGVLTRVVGQQRSR